MIEDTKIILLLEETNDLLRTLIEITEQNQEKLSEAISNLSIKKAPRKNVSSSLSPEDKKEIEESMFSLEDWFQIYGEEPRPAKYVNSAGLGEKEAYTKPEMDYVFNRLIEIAALQPKNASGTHFFKYLGKTYCKPEGNTVNCFAFVPR